MILQPQKDFPLVRQIANHLDTATYYVQAVVRDADGNVIDTIQLEDKGGQRFQKRYRVPVDQSGSGTYISIVTSVYTDSGYTTKSSNYGDEENTYLIFDKLARQNGGGGVNFDLSDIRYVIKEEIEKIEKQEMPEIPEIPEIPEYSKQFQTILSKIDDIQKQTKEIPKEETDLMPVLEGIQNLAQAIYDKEVTPETDLTPILTEIQTMIKEIEQDMDANNEDREVFKDELKELIVKTMEDSVANTEYTYETAIRPRKGKSTVERDEPVKFNLKDLV